jgi:hypothetical protein
LATELIRPQTPDISYEHFIPQKDKLPFAAKDTALSEDRIPVRKDNPLYGHKVPLPETSDAFLLQKWLKGPGHYVF